MYIHIYISICVSFRNMHIRVCGYLFTYIHICILHNVKNMSHAFRSSPGIHAVLPLYTRIHIYLNHRVGGRRERGREERRDRGREGNTLQQAATHRSTLQQQMSYTKRCRHRVTRAHPRPQAMQHTATHCITLQQTATHCSTLQQQTPYRKRCRHHATRPHPRPQA